MIVKNIVTALVVICATVPVAVNIYKNISRKLDTCEDGGSCVRICCHSKLPCESEDHHNISYLGEASTLDKNYKFINGTPYGENCYRNDEVWSFNQDGTVQLNETGTLMWEDYCLSFNGDEHFVLVCSEITITEDIKELYPYFMIASIPFLIVTFFVFGCVKELRNLHGKCLMCYVFSLLVLLSSLVTVNLYHKQLIVEHKEMCVFLGYTVLFGILLCFFWLNVMCFDIFSTFKNGRRHNSSTTFLWYCFYAFGLSLLIILVVFILNHMELIPEEYQSKIGKDSCQVTTRTREFIYVYLPIIVTLTINIIFYSITAWKIYRVHNETAICRENLARKYEKHRFSLYVRLFIVMGIIWIIEVLSWTFDGSIILYIGCILNCMQGYIIFALFVWRTRVLTMLAKAELVSFKFKYEVSRDNNVSYKTGVSTSK